MATKLQDYQAKRKELQATNPNATMLDAKSALSPIANAPVAWQAPAITPITPEPVAPAPIDNKQVLANNQAKVQWEIQAWTRPEVGQQATQAQTPKIIQQAQNQTMASNLPSQLSAQDQATIDRMTAEGRFIPPEGTRTPSWATMNPDWTVTWNTWLNIINQAKEDIKTWAIRSFDSIPWNIEYKSWNKWAVLPATVQGIFTALATKADIPDAQKALPSYKIAQNRFTKANMYSSMTPTQLAQDVNDAKIVEGSPAWEDIKMLNPKLVKDVQNLNTVNGTKSNIFTYVNNPDGTKTKENNLVKTFVSDYEDNYWDIVKVLQGIYGQDTAEEARAKIYTPDVKSAEDKATQIELEMNALSDTMAWVDKDVEKELAGTGATWSRIALEKQYRNEQLTNKYNSLQKNYTTYANKANNLITQNTDLYKSEQAQKAQLNKALAGIAVKWYEAQQAEKIAKATLNDPTKAIPALIEQYTKLGVPMQRSVQEMIAEAQNEIANGWTLASYLTKLQQTIQSKPEYKAYQEKQTGTEWQSANITRYNPLTWANESTPVFYRKKTGWAGFEAVDLSWNPIDANLLGWGIWETWPTWWFATWTTEMRTDRNMNPTAFTTDIAKQAGLVEWVDYVKGDKFPWSSNLYTAKLIGDPIETSIRVIDSIWFKTKWGQNRWTYTDKLWLNNDTWAKMSPTDKATAIKKMYQQEWGNGTAIGEQQAESTQTEFTKAPEYQDYLNNWKLPSWMKAWTIAYQDWKKWYDAWKEQTKPLSSEQKSRVDKYVLDFENQPEIKDYSLIQTNVNAARKYAQWKSNTDDQALIYSFAKVMDPNSVVRESEYATVQEYSQALLWRYLGKIWRIYSTDWFLTEDAKEKMVKTLGKKEQAAKESYDSITKQKASQINKITWGKDWETYLTDFSVSEQPQVAPEQIQWTPEQKVSWAIEFLKAQWIY